MSRESNRERFPEFAKIMDELGPDARMVCIRDHAGNVLAGRIPDDEPKPGTAFYERMGVA